MAALAVPGAAFAVGSDDSEPPTPTETTTECTDGLVWNPDTEACVDPADQGAGLSPDALYGAVRELAYAGRYDDALRVVNAMPHDDRALTYLGFIHRKIGNYHLGMEYYAKALMQNPKNSLTLSYRGMAHVQRGRIDLARADLAAIGDRQSWAWQALNQAIETGDLRNY